MNWIFYSLINITKFTAISCIFLLSALALPILGVIFILGMLLGILRDAEPHFLQNKNKQLALSFPNIKLDYILLWPAKIARIQHAWIQRNKSTY